LNKKEEGEATLGKAPSEEEREALSKQFLLVGRREKRGLLPPDLYGLSRWGVGGLRSQSHEGRHPVSELPNGLKK